MTMDVKISKKNQQAESKNTLKRWHKMIKLKSSQGHKDGSTFTINQCEMSHQQKKRQPNDHLKMPKKHLIKFNIHSY